MATDALGQALPKAADPFREVPLQLTSPDCHAYVAFYGSNGSIHCIFDPSKVTPKCPTKL